VRLQHWFYAIPLRLKSLFLRPRVERDLDDEVEFHIEMQVRELIAAGMPEQEARFQARVQFGAQALIKDECRDQRRLQLFETLIQDIRYAVRGLRRAPAFALTVALTIGLGLGVNTAVFTIFNAYVLRPVEVPDPYSLYEAFWSNRTGVRSFTASEFEGLRRERKLSMFTDVYSSRSLQIRLNSHPSFGELVSGNYFHLLGVRPALGRMLTPEDSWAPGRQPVAVLSYSAWQSMFGGDPAIVGKKVLAGGYPLEVVGVAREGFIGLLEVRQDFWAPITLLPQLDPDRAESLDAGMYGRAGAIIRMFGRLKSGVSVTQAEAALFTAAPLFTSDRAAADRPIGAVLRSRATNVPVSSQAVENLLPIFAAFGLVLLIACANVTNMMLARTMARQREIGIRLSLGAARARLIRQLLTESIVLALPSVLVGYLISDGILELGMRAMWATIPGEFAEFIRIAPLTLDWRVFAFMMAAAVTTAFLFGLAPAIQATRTSVVQTARGDFGNEFRPSRFRNALVVAQIAGCASLLICAAVMLQGANRVSLMDTGLRTRGVIDLEIREQSRSRVLAALASEPLVEKVGASSQVPLDGGFPAAQVSRTGDPSVIYANFDQASPEFFEVFGIGVDRGRNFTQEEARTGAPVAVVSKTLARRMWGAGDPIGQSIKLQRDKNSHIPGEIPFQEMTVVGVVNDINTGMSDSDGQRTFVFFPGSSATKGMMLAIQVKGDVEAARVRIDDLLTKTDPGAVNYIHKMDQFKAARVYPLRVAWWVSSAVGGLALLLTVAGIYGVLSYLVTQRAKEIGIRMALGASRGEVVGLVLRQSLKMVFIGLGIAVVLGAGVSQLLGSQFLLMRGLSVTPYIGTIALVFVAAMAATLVPSRRAVRIDPMTTLRCE